MFESSYYVLRVGLEPTTIRLTVGSSAIELPENYVLGVGIAPTALCASNRCSTTELSKNYGGSRRELNPL